jgi:two-component system chemotaxis sensor kinase CheA
MSDVTFSEFFQDFLVESTDHLQEYEKCLLEIEAEKLSGHSPAIVDDRIQSIFRSVHTIKGLAAMVGLSDIKDYTHEAENLLDSVRSGRLMISAALIEVLYRILDTCRKLIGIQINPLSPKPDLTAEIDRIQAVLETDEPDTTKPIPANVPKAEPSRSSQPSQSVNLSTPVIRVDTRRLDDLLGIVGELVIAKNRMTDTARSVGENLRRIAPSQTSLHTTLTETVENAARLIISLQEATMKLRMVPIGNAFRKFERAVRDIAKQSGKQIQFVKSGESTEVDRLVIEAMEDPLLHLLRNAIDHGIETSSERMIQGKSPVGTLRLSASQENNMIVIVVEDDGRGIDPKNILRKAIEKGVASAQGDSNDKAALAHIFTPGFSTAEVITDLSGRGVGLDVVKKNILRLNGTIDVQSVPQKGTAFILRLPLTLAIIQVLLVKLDGRRYSIPLSQVYEILDASGHVVKETTGYRIVQIRDSVLPLFRLDELLGIRRQDAFGNGILLVVGFGEKRIALLVDDVSEQQDVVIKSLGTHMDRITGISGATILGNGEVSLVLDIAGLFQDGHSNKKTHGNITSLNGRETLCP